jgi:hypothetical protein
MNYELFLFFLKKKNISGFNIIPMSSVSLKIQDAVSKSTYDFGFEASPAAVKTVEKLMPLAESKQAAAPVLGVDEIMVGLDIFKIKNVYLYINNVLEGAGTKVNKNDFTLLLLTNSPSPKPDFNDPAYKIYARMLIDNGTITIDKVDNNVVNVIMTSTSISFQSQLF